MTVVYRYDANQISKKILYDTYDIDIKVFYDKCPNTFVFQRNLSGAFSSKAHKIISIVRRNFRSPD